MPRKKKEKTSEKAHGDGATEHHHAAVHKEYVARLANALRAALGQRRKESSELSGVRRWQNAKPHTCRKAAPIRVSAPVPAHMQERLRDCGWIGERDPGTG